jgi:molybdopterin synthase sulfur carrier subunit
MTIRVAMPAHLRTIAKVSGDVDLDVAAPVTIPAILDALEARFPALQGTIRDHVTRVRRPFIRFFVCAEDWSHHPPEALLPSAITNGEETFLIVGAIAGGTA